VNKKTVYILSHTHWDREWYLRKETFLMMLVDLVDRMIHILTNDEEFTLFMLDGQTIVLEDYLSVRPGREAILKDLIAKGKILIGPWYVLPDEYLISGEGHIRNYLVGDQICTKMGAKMNVGYLPDSFGHPSQMPQILKGLGLEQIVFWRGLSDEITQTELVWEGLDGSEILGINMPYGYGMGACLPEDEDAFVQRMQSIIDRLEPMTQTDSLLVMQGTDHVAPMPLLPELLAKARKRLPAYSFKHASLQQYLDSLPTDMELQRAQGELRSGYRAYLLGGTISTRMYLKQENFYRERDLITYAEPLQVLASVLSGEEYQQDIINYAFKLYLKNMPHDSICGCSIDEVHDEMMLRYMDLASVTDHLIERSVRAIASSLSPVTEEKDGNVMVFNPQSQPLEHEMVTTELVYEKKLIRKVNYATSVLEENYPVLEKQDPSGITCITSAGTILKGRICAIHTDGQAMDLSLETQPEMYLEKRIEVEFPIDSIPALGFSMVGYRWEYGAVELPKPASSTSIENASLLLSLDLQESQLIITDKSTRQSYTLTFVDTGDAGDVYTYSAPKFDKPVSWKIVDSHTEVTPIASLITVEGYLDLPVGVTQDRLHRSETTTRCPLVVKTVLHNDSHTLEFSVDFENLALDHRLRMELTTGEPYTFSYAESLFGVDVRNLHTFDDTSYEDWVELPSTNSHKTFVALRGEKGAVCVANRGLPGFETHENDDGNTTVALTLLRCVGWLSRYDLLSRKGNGAWTIETPGAQCLGAHTFDFALIIQRGAFDLAALAIASHAFAYPLRGWQIEDSELTLDEAKIYSLCTVSSPAITISALKKAEDGDGLIMRLYNTTEEIVNNTLSFSSPLSFASLTDLKELDIEECEIENSTTLALVFAPWQIRTIRVKLR